MRDAQRIIDLCEENIENIRQTRIYNREGLLAAFFQQIKGQPPSGMSIGALEGYRYDHELATVMAHLPLETVADEFGNELLLWSWFHTIGAPKTRIEESITSTIEPDINCLKKAEKHVNYNTAAGSKAITFITAYRMMKKAQAEPGTSDLSGLLRANALNSIELTDNRVRDYSLESMTTLDDYHEGWAERWGEWRDQGGRARFRVYLDAPSALGLMYKGLPNALVAFAPSDKETIMIYQLQGIVPELVHARSGLCVATGHSRGLAVLDWQKMLVECVDQMFSGMFTRIAIQSAHNNHWRRSIPGEKDARLPLCAGLKKYDLVADRLGFTRGDDRNWYRTMDYSQ